MNLTVGSDGRVRTKSNNSLRAAYYYDALGRRMQRDYLGETTLYLHDGANPIQLQDASGAAVENLLAGGIDEWLVRTRDGQTQYFLSDALGSTLRLVDSAGAKVVDYSYDPYGGTTSDNAGDTNRFQYTGRENEGLGLYFNRARYYKPKWGRFISQDPIGLAGGDSAYAYVGGAPLDYADPSGYIRKKKNNRSTEIIPKNQRLRDCNAEEYARCASACLLSKGVKLCDVRQIYKIKEARSGEPPTYEWRDGPQTCLCNDEDEPNSCSGSN